MEKLAMEYGYNTPEFTAWADVRNHLYEQEVAKEMEKYRWDYEGDDKR